MILTPEIERLLAMREQVRTNGDLNLAWEITTKLLSLGYREEERAVPAKLETAGGGQLPRRKK